jgi:ABC-2 type transport system permease protein
MSLFLHEFRAQQRLFWRAREAAFFTFFLPVILFLMFGSIYGDDTIKKEAMKGSSFLQAGMIGYGIAATCFAGLALIMTLGRTLFGVPVPEDLLSVFAILLIGAASFAAMGLGITALVRSAEGSSAVINAIYLPMAVLSGTFFSTARYPPVLHAIASVLPLTHFTEVTRDVMVRNEHVWQNLGSLSIVLAWGLVGLVGAIRGFRWQPRESL